MTLSPELLAVLSDLGFPDTEAFIREQLQKELNIKITNYQRQIKSFEEKYGCDWDTFRQQQLAPTAPENFSHWDDSIEWEWAVSSLSYYQERLNWLEDA